MIGEVIQTALGLYQAGFRVSGGQYEEAFEVTKEDVPLAQVYALDDPKVISVLGVRKELVEDVGYFIQSLLGLDSPYAGDAAWLSKVLATASDLMPNQQESVRIMGDILQVCVRETGEVVVRVDVSQRSARWGIQLEGEDW